MSDPHAFALEPVAEPDLAGRQLGDYLLLRRLGRGAMAEVYLAEQTSLRREVAIKVLRSSLAGDATYVQRFHQEAQAAASLVHAHIVQIHEVGCREGIHYIAQEYVAGQNLRELLARHGALDARMAVTVLGQVALALQQAAQRGIVHRDIKPENIMLSRGGEVKVADFGLARQTDGAAHTQLTQVGITMGTPLYMSPEQVEGRRLDSRSDLYSLGVTCFHMLTGQPPFRGDTALSVAVQHLNATPERLEQLRPDLPPALCRVVHRLLAKKIEDRYASPRELLVALRQLHLPGLDQDAWQQSLASAGIDAISTGMSRASDQLTEVMKTSALLTRERRHARRRWWLVLAGAFLLGASLAWVDRDRPLLVRAPAVAVPQYASAREQFVAAQMQSTHQEDWLRSVERYFPTDEFFVPRAQQELVRLYLRTNRADEALAVSEQLAALKASAQTEFRAFGLAGEAVVLAMRGQQQRASQALAELAPIRQKLDPRMSALMAFVVRQQQQTMDRRAAAEWDQWLKTLAAEPAAETSD